MVISLNLSFLQLVLTDLFLEVLARRLTGTTGPLEAEWGGFLGGLALLAMTPGCCITGGRLGSLVDGAPGSLPGGATRLASGTTGTPVET